ncbi:hypothetical protein HBH50_231350 [Parastagonospora nodorum]|nr:hypothetical protein HBH50_231350 [Parastagonospora nodorum]KAH4078886.1 hypothetical protein HBH48_224820 [Parastagonospora nodorum]
MPTKTTLSFGALIALAGAQSAPGFPVSASQQLTVKYGNNTVSPPGELIPRGETASPPSISSPVWYAGERGASPGLLLMVDIDVPRNGTRVPLLHWMATNVTSQGSSGALDVPNSPVPYLQPSPPVGDVPHAYTFIVFPQPANFTVPAKYLALAQNQSLRVGFNTSAFIAEVGLKQAIAANYITVQNLTGTAATTFPPARPTQSPSATPSKPAQFTGTAPLSMVGGATMWAGLAAAMLAGVAAVAL